MNGWVINGNGLDHYLIFFQCSSNEKLRLFTDSFFDAVCHTIVINGLLSCFRCYTVKITIMQKKLIKISTLQPLLLKCDPYKIRQLLSLDDHHSNYSVLHYDWSFMLNTTIYLIDDHLKVTNSMDTRWFVGYTLMIMVILPCLGPLKHFMAQFVVKYWRLITVTEVLYMYSPNIILAIHLSSFLFFAKSLPHIPRLHSTVFILIILIWIIIWIILLSWCHGIS